MDSGYAEFNDADAVIRGVMVAANGEFSGKFSTENVNAISSVNIRGGSVTSHIVMDLDTKLTTFTFVVPPIPQADTIEVNIPVEVSIGGTLNNIEGSVKVYREGVLMATDTYTPRDLNYLTIYLLQTLRIVDLNPNPDEPSTYKIVLTSNGNAKDYVNWVTVKFVGPIIIGARKR